MKFDSYSFENFDSKKIPPLFAYGEEVVLRRNFGFDIWAESTPFIREQQNDLNLSKEKTIEIALTKKYVIRSVEQRSENIDWIVQTELDTGHKYRNMYFYWLDEIVVDPSDDTERIVKRRAFGVPEPFLKSTYVITQHDNLNTTIETNSSWGMF